MNISIYALIDPITGIVRYVGKAADFSIRFSRHIAGCRSAKRRHYPVNRWISGLLELGLKPNWRILELSDDNGWVEAEKRWIAHFRASTPSLLNVTDGGEGASYKSTPERNKKISESTLGRVIPQDVRDKISRTLTGRKLPQNPRRSEVLMGNKRLLGRKLPSDHKAKVLAALQSEESNRKRIASLKALAKEWIITTPDGNEICIVSLLQFSKDHGLDPGCMNKIAHGKQGRKQHKGYTVRPAMGKFLGDCTHALAGQTVPIPEWPSSNGDDE